MVLGGRLVFLSVKGVYWPRCVRPSDAHGRVRFCQFSNNLKTQTDGHQNMIQDTSKGCIKDLNKTGYTVNK